MGFHIFLMELFAIKKIIYKKPLKISLELLSETSARLKLSLQ